MKIDIKCELWLGTWDKGLDVECDGDSISLKMQNYTDQKNCDLFLFSFPFLFVKCCLCMNLPDFVCDENS